MHSLHYKSLPFALSVYCHRPQHSYATRYAASKNYILPPVHTDRGKKSIKFSGPKAWADVPTDLKEIAFRKPFSKHLKKHILTTTYVDMPQGSNSSLEDDDVEYRELEELFLSDDDESEFKGFDSADSIDLEMLFHSDEDTSDFEGFLSSELGEIFHSASDESDFEGF